MSLLVSPRFELFFALAAVLDPGLPDPLEEATSRWLAQARRKLDPGFRRRLGALAAPEIWRWLAVLPGTAVLQGTTGDVIDALADLAPARFAGRTDGLQAQAVDVLRRFDRLAFAAFWRGAEARLAAMADSLPGNAAPEQFRDTITFSSLFATTDQVALQAPSGATVAVRFVTPAAKPGSRPHTIAIHPPSASPASPVIDDPEPVFRALGDATRYAIARLIAREAMTSADLARRLGVSGPTLTHHLKLLRQTRLVIEERRGNSILLRLDRRAIETLSVAAVGSLFGAGPVAIRRSRRA